MGRIIRPLAIVFRSRAATSSHGINDGRDTATRVYYKDTPLYAQVRFTHIPPNSEVFSR